MAHETNRDLPHIEPFLQNTPELQTLWGSAIALWTSNESISAFLCDTAVDWLKEWQQKEKTADRPFAMWLSFPDPHEFY
jgi:hypothetical protein